MVAVDPNRVSGSTGSGKVFRQERWTHLKDVASKKVATWTPGPQFGESCGG